MLKYPLSADVQSVLEHISSPDLYVRNAIAAYPDDTPIDGTNKDKGSLKKQRNGFQAALLFLSKSMIWL